MQVLQQQVLKVKQTHGIYSICPIFSSSDCNDNAISVPKQKASYTQKMHRSIVKRCHTVYKIQYIKKIFFVIRLLLFFGIYSSPVVQHQPPCLRKYPHAPEYLDNKTYQFRSLALCWVSDPVCNGSGLIFLTLVRAFKT